MTTPEQAREEKAKLWNAIEAGTDNPNADPAPTTKPADVIPADAADATGAAAATATAATPDANAAAAEDPYKDLPDNVRHEILGLKAMLSSATQRQRSTDGRIGGLQSELKQLKEALQSRQPASAGGTPSGDEIAAAQGNPQAMAKLVEEYPEFGKAMKGAIDEVLKPLQEQVKSLSSKESSAPVGPGDLDRLKRELQVETRHPNWQERVNTPQFTGWLQEQPDNVKALASSRNPQDAIALLDLHQEAVTPVTQRQTTSNQRLRAAASIPSGRSPAPRAKPTDQMTKAEYWAHLDQLEAQKVS